VFFGRKISPLTGLKDMEYDSIVVTSYLKREIILRALLDHGIEEKNIQTIFNVSVDNDHGTILRKS